MQLLESCPLIQPVLLTYSLRWCLSSTVIIARLVCAQCDANPGTDTVQIALDKPWEGHHICETPPLFNILDTHLVLLYSISHYKVLSLPTLRINFATTSPALIHNGIVCTKLASNVQLSDQSRLHPHCAAPITRRKQCRGARYLPDRKSVV